jgi:serine/threonine-protein kinase
VPRDLETICLKCLRKQPHQRYPSAEALADDLRRFQEGAPILAKAVGPCERVLKWARRRPAVAALVAVSLVAALSLLVGGWWSWAALRASAVREGQQREEAEENFRQALEAVEQLLAEVGAVDLADVPHMETVRKGLLLRALGFYRRFLARRGTDPALRQETGRASSRVGDIQEMLGEPAEAEQAYDQAIALLEQPPADAPRRRELARSHHQRGVLLKKVGRFPEAEQALRQALRLREELAEEFPGQADEQQDLAASRYHLGALLAPLAGRRPEAEQAYRQALAVREQLAAGFPERPDYQRELARTLNNLGILQQATGRAEAEKAFGRARDIQRPLASRFPAVTGYRRDLARSCSNLGAVLATGGRREAAVESFREGRDLLAKLAGDFPTVREYRNDLAALHNNLGMQFQALGRALADRDPSRSASLMEEAETALREAVALRTRMAAEVPAVPEYRQKLAGSLLNLAILLADTRRPHEAEEVLRQALPVQERLAADFPNVPDHQSALGATWNHLARLLLNRGDLGEPGQGAELVRDGASGTPWNLLGSLFHARAAWTEARDSLKQALAHQGTALAANPQNPLYRQYLRNDYAVLATVLLRLGDHAAAAAAAEELPRLFTDVPVEHVRAAEFLARCVPVAERDGGLPEARRQEVARGYARRAVELLRAAAARGFKEVGRLKELPVYEPLRGRDDFKKLLQELEEGTKIGVG